MFDDMPSIYTKTFLVLFYYTNKLRYQGKIYQYLNVKPTFTFWKVTIPVVWC
jgi:hypothetical protein